MRRLLPYEHQLVKHLGITEDDYLDFLALQRDYAPSQEEREQELRAEVATIALVLTIVGTLFQVAAALLAPKPEQQATNRNRRDQVFAPRFGFNSAQELAKYGDTVNLIYTNRTSNLAEGNPDGGVRAATSLVWSAVNSLGTSQFMQLLLVIGAGRLGGIDAAKTAFGQTPVRQFVSQKTWTYFNASGPVTFANLISGRGPDPAARRLATSDPVNQITLRGSRRREGFSQSFSPSTLNRCGIYAPIPIKVQVEVRDDKGRIRDEALGITIEKGLVGRQDDGNNYWPGLDAFKSRPLVPVGHRFTLRFEKIDDANQGADEKQTAVDTRRALFNNIDGASIYKLGSAKYRVSKANDGNDLEDESIDVVFECIESGVCPQEDYSTQTYQENEREAKDFIVDLQERNAELQALLDQNGGLGPPIFNPDKADDVARLEGQVDALNDAIEELRAFRSSSLQLRDLEVNAYNDPIVNQIIQEIDLLEENLEEARESGASRKVKQAIKREIKRAERKLKKAIIEYGLQNGVNGGGQNIKDLIKTQKRQLTRYQKQLSNVVNNSAYWDTAAMKARNDEYEREINKNSRLIEEENNNLTNENELNDYFNTKCLVKIEEASYSTITQCKVVDFALKARVFKRVQGRAKEYGEVKEERFRDSNNGVKFRSFFFWFLYRKAGSELAENDLWERVPRIFVIRRTGDIDNYVSLKFIANDNDGGWEFKFDPIAETAAEMRTHGLADFAFLENSGGSREIDLPNNARVTFTGSLRDRKDTYQSPLNRNPYLLDEWGLFSLRSDTQCQFSFDNGPELTIVAVTEQREEPFSNYPSLYHNLSMLAFNTFSGQGIQDLRSLSVYVTQGRLVRRIRDDGTFPSEPDGATSFAPDVFLDTILDTEDGIGQYAKISGVDLPALALAKKFCRRNQLYFDGVIAQQAPWRQFWAEVAPFSLLELARIGGKETLVPSVPCNNDGLMDRRVSITSMFTAGNILEDSYKEEHLDYGNSTQDLIATVIYRETKAAEVFPRNTSVEIKLRDVIDVNAVRQTFDLSQYVTSRCQAISYAKLLCNQRRHLRRGIEFRTFPTATAISPGAYIYVDIGQSQWNGIHSGIIEAGGALNAPVASGVPDGSYSVLLHKAGENVVSLAGIQVTEGGATALAPYTGWLFVLGSNVSSKRVFRVNEVQMDEEGEVTVRAVEHPCVIDGSLTLSKVAQFSNDPVPAEGHPGFLIDGRPPASNECVLGAG